MTDQIVVALAQLDFIVGDTKGNTDRIIEYANPPVRESSPGGRCQSSRFPHGPTELGLVPMVNHLLMTFDEFTHGANGIAVALPSRRDDARAWTKCCSQRRFSAGPRLDQLTRRSVSLKETRTPIVVWST